MAIPKGAIPTPKGWVHPKTGELLKSQKMTAAQIAEFYGTSAPAPAPAPAPVMQTLHEAPAVERPVTSEEIAHHDDDAPVEEEKKSWRDIF